MFVDGLDGTQLLAGCGNVVVLRAASRPGTWCGAAAASAPSCSASAAFVVGVSSYPAPFSLSTCRADAEGMGWLLHRKGYSVTRLLDPASDKLVSSFNRFVTGLPSGVTVVVFFSGHGAQLNGVNVVLPLDALELGKVHLIVCCVRQAACPNRAAFVVGAHEAGSPGESFSIVVSNCVAVSNMLRNLPSTIAVACVLLDSCRTDAAMAETNVEGTPGSW
jgi:hypothetical protein